MNTHKSKIVKPLEQPAQARAIEDSASKIQSNLWQMANNVVSEKYIQQINELQQKCTGQDHTINKLQEQLSNCKEFQKWQEQLQQKEKQIQAKQEQVNQKQNAINNRLKNQTKEIQILKMYEKLKKDTINMELQNTFQLQKSTLQRLLSKIQQSLKTKSQEYQNVKGELTLSQEASENNRRELIASKSDLTALRSKYEKQKLEWESYKINLAAECKAIQKQFVNSLEKQWSTRLQEKEWKIEDISRSNQAKRKQVQAQMASQAATIASMKKEITSYNQQITSINQEFSKKVAAYQHIKTQYQSIQINYQKDVQSTKTALQIEYTQELSRMYAEFDDRITKQVQSIKKEHLNQLNQIRTSADKTVSKLQETFQQQVKQFNSRVQAYQRQLADNKNIYDSNLKQTEDNARHQIIRLQNVLANISTIVLQRTYNVSDNQKIIEAIQNKINDLRQKAEEATVNQATLKERNDALQSNSKEMKRWFSNIGMLINSTDAAQTLKRNRQYAIDQDILTAINNFTSKLQNRLAQYKSSEEEQRKRIDKLSEDLKQASAAMNESERQVTNLREQNRLMDEKIRSVALERQQNEQLLRQQAASSQAECKRVLQQLKSLQQSNTQKEAAIIALKGEIATLENVKIVAFQKRITEYAAKNQDQSSQLAKMQAQLADLQRQKRLLSESLANRELECSQRKSQLQELKQQMNSKERQWSSQQEVQLNKLRAIVNEIYGSPNLDNNFTSLLDYMRNNKPGSEAVPLTVSPIFFSAPKERAILEGHICGFLQCRSFTSTFLYKYDQFNKNFSNYLPIKEPYDFVILAKTKKSQIFGVLSCGLGPRSKAMAFNLNSGKIFLGDSKESSSTYDGGYLIFGQGEIRFRSNSSLQMVVVTRIFNTRYFSFPKEDLVGVETGDSVLLDALEIHRINH